MHHDDCRRYPTKRRVVSSTSVLTTPIGASLVTRRGMRAFAAYVPICPLPFRATAKDVVAATGDLLRKFAEGLM